MATHIYTRTGDKGDTGLFGGQRVRKDSLRVEAYGSVDELNAALGVALAQSPENTLASLLLRIQNDLFLLGADLATPEEKEKRKGQTVIQRIRPELTTHLETWIDRLEAELPPLKQFILPGGHPLAAQLHLCRVVCRRAERCCVALARPKTDTAEPASTVSAINPEILRYLNRLSDLLFVLARCVNHRQGVADIPWNP
jgi:cob(I)alamin adenosyltransferase